MSLKLQDIFDQLMAGEFSQLSIGGQDAGVINEGNYKQAVAHVNLGLAALYRRFNLKEGRLKLSLQPTITTYSLKSDYAVANRRSRQPIRYILDDAHAPFIDDLFKVERVLTDRELELSLNDGSDAMSCFTPSMSTLVVPDGIVNPTNDTPTYLRTTYLTVVYRASHPVLTVGLGLFDPSKVDIELPYSHLEALMYFVAARTQAPVGLGNEFNASTRYAAKYEQVCQELAQVNLRVDVGQGNQRLYQKGFV